MASGVVVKRLKELGLRPKYYRQKVSEDRTQFIDRMVKQLPRILVKCESDVPTIANLYGVDPDLVKFVMQENRSKKFKVGGKSRTLRQYETEGLAIASAREKYDAEVSNKIKAKALKDIEDTTEKRVQRRNWPTDPDERVAAIFDFLMDALVQYGANLVEIAEHGNLELWDIQRAINASAALQTAQAEGMDVRVAMSESRMFHLAETSTNPGAAKTVLTNFSGGRWSDRQDVTVRSVGFEAPKEDEEQVSILTIVKNKKEAE